MAANVPKNAGFDFEQFMAWYSQAGTPKVTAHGEYNAVARNYTLTLTQTCPPTPGQAGKMPCLIPIALGLVGPDGVDLNLGDGLTACVLRFSEPEQVFVFENIPAPPVPSLLRNFSAPVVLEFAYSEAELAHLLAHDSDSFNRWEAGQRLFGELILRNTARLMRGQVPEWPGSGVEAARKVLLSSSDKAFIAEALTLPGEATLAEQMEVVDPDALHEARNGLARALAAGLERDLLALYEAQAPVGAYRSDTAEAARRRLRNLCLAYLNELDSPAYRDLAMVQFDRADNMTDQFAALSTLANAPGNDGGKALAAFFERWRHEALVVDKWLAVQASSRRPDTLERVEQLMQHPAFDLKNPNKVYALLRTFGANHRHFHAADGSGYCFVATQVAALDQINPQVAARLARCFDRWQKFDERRRNYAEASLESIHIRPGLSRDVFEVVDKALG